MGDSPLHVAASHGHLNIVNLLLEAGNDVTLRNNADCTAQELASDSIIKNAIQMSQQHSSAKAVHDYNEEDYNDESD
jgi:ankyrin repeat protein